MTRTVDPSTLDRKSHPRPKPKVLRDAGGRPVIGCIMRETKLEEPSIVARPVRFFCPLEERMNPAGRISLYRRAKIVFRGSPRWYDSRDVIAPPKDGMAPMSLMRALRTLSHDFWWVSSSGALERRATNYEARLPTAVNEEFPPHPGWRLISSNDVASLISYSKHTASREVMPTRSETDKARVVVAKLKRLDRELRHAEGVLSRHKADLAKRERIVRKWEKKIEKLRGSLATD